MSHVTHMSHVTSSHTSETRPPHQSLWSVGPGELQYGVWAPVSPLWFQNSCFVVTPEIQIPFLNPYRTKDSINWLASIYDLLFTYHINSSELCNLKWCLELNKLCDIYNPQGAPPTKTVLGSMPSAIPHKTQTAISVMATTAQLVGVLY